MSRFFKTWNTILGWLSFTIALVVYALTTAPTLSFWDCGEYISTSAKLQVGHPPGAPIFQMIGAVVSMFAPDETLVAFMMNLLSGFCGALTAMFLFWTTTTLLRKLLSQQNPLNKRTEHMVLFSAFVAAMTLTFSTTFWFNATETEVYSMSTLLISVMFWSILKWEEAQDSKRNDKWLVLLGLLTGMTFGIHLMALLVIPAIIFVILNKERSKPLTTQRFIVYNLVGISILGFVFKLLLPISLKLFGYTEIFFVNVLRLPYNTGSIILALGILYGFYRLIKWSHNKTTRIQSFVLLLVFIYIGLSSWLMIPIRANANTPINENNPSDALGLISYYNMDQYPKVSIFFGPQFTAKYNQQGGGFEDGNPKYEKNLKKGTYEIINDYKNTVVKPAPKHIAFLPRMWSIPNAANYLRIIGPLEVKIKPQYFSNQDLVNQLNYHNQSFEQGTWDPRAYEKFLSENAPALNINKPSFAQNIKYLLDFQLGYMFFRYFMWNFSGRQDNEQGFYDPLHGNWISGITLLDEARLGPQTGLPSQVKNNKARNKYYLLPFLLGILGISFCFNKDRYTLWPLVLLFLFTGIGVVFFTNARAFEPRERDYAIVGSVYTFVIFIGFGVYALYEYLKDTLKFKVPHAITFLTIFVPILMACQNYDDRDRSGRDTPLSASKNYLNSCSKDAILFTIGDNDTFPLWYLQEIEGYRTDIRIINTQLIMTDWYIDQLKRKVYDAEPVPSKLTHNKYRYGTREALYYRELTKDTISLSALMKWIARDDPRFMLTTHTGRKLHTFPAKYIKVPVDKEKVLANGLVRPEDASKIEPFLYMHIKQSYLTKGQMMALDILNSNNWNRPIYFSGGSPQDSEYMWLKDYLVKEGTVFKLVPIKTGKTRFGFGKILDTEKMYSWFIDQVTWGNVTKGIYLDPITRRNLIYYRQISLELIDKLIEEKKPEKAEQIMDLLLHQTVPQKTYDYALLEYFVDYYYKIGKREKAQKLAQDMIALKKEILSYFKLFDPFERVGIYGYLNEIVTQYSTLISIMKSHKDNTAKQEESFKKLIETL